MLLGSLNGDKMKSTVFSRSSARIAFVIAFAALMSSFMLPVVSMANARVFAPFLATSLLNVFSPT